MVWPNDLKKRKCIYCSVECSVDSQRLRKEIECQYCGKKVELWPSRMKNGKGKYCSQTCYSKDTTIHFDGKRFLNTKRQVARRKALKAFEPICVVCGKPEEHCHHKDCNPANNDITNLVLLCEPCHIDIHREIRERAG